MANNKSSSTNEAPRTPESIMSSLKKSDMFVKYTNPEYLDRVQAIRERIYAGFYFDAAGPSLAQFSGGIYVNRVVHATTVGTMATLPAHTGKKPISLRQYCERLRGMPQPASDVNDPAPAPAPIDHKWVAATKRVKTCVKALNAARSRPAAATTPEASKSIPTDDDDDDIALERRLQAAIDNANAQAKRTAPTPRAPTKKRAAEEQLMSDPKRRQGCAVSSFTNRQYPDGTRSESGFAPPLKSPMAPRKVRFVIPAARSEEELSPPSTEVLSPPSKQSRPPHSITSHDGASGNTAMTTPTTVTSLADRRRMDAERRQHALLHNRREAPHTGAPTARWPEIKKVQQRKDTDRMKEESRRLKLSKKTSPAKSFVPGPKPDEQPEGDKRARTPLHAAPKTTLSSSRLDPEQQRRADEREVTFRLRDLKGPQEMLAGRIAFGSDKFLTPALDDLSGNALAAVLEFVRDSLADARKAEKIIEKYGMRREWKQSKKPKTAGARHDSCNGPT